MVMGQVEVVAWFVLDKVVYEEAGGHLPVYQCSVTIILSLSVLAGSSTIK